MIDFNEDRMKHIPIVQMPKSTILMDLEEIERKVVASLAISPEMLGLKNNDARDAMAFAISNLKRANKRAKIKRVSRYATYAIIAMAVIYLITLLYQQV